MKLSYYCSSCKKENYLKTSAPDRYAFLIEYGKNEINERCKHCGNHTKKDINRLHAEPNNIIIVGGVILAIIITVFLWDFGFVSTLSGTIPIGIWVDQNKKTNLFNRSRVR
ncbi:hypothetical protein Q4Q39_11605 [Flavivirga amylovorans]|uniref:CXXC-20-CXXC protein n=1 Tax=Flavivirga amylovorans TaxID=870486 RepID=A0ABT8X269_9FLAO|nr:hypothetical protein [Flavivirga amylovorans]MDO5988050.1 hypothetical protein [Flavivirga amylovorans]